MNEQEFLAGYDPRAYPPVAVTVDVVALTIRDGALHVLLSSAASRPFAGHAGRCPAASSSRDEDLDRRRPARAGRGDRARAASGSAASTWSSSAATAHPDRDPRMRVVSVAYLAFAPDLPDPAAGSDAADGDLGAGDRADQPAARLRPRRDPRRRARARPLQAGVHAAGHRASSAPSSPSPSCAPSTRRSGASSCTPATSTARCCRCRASWRAPARRTERGGARGGPRARLYRAGDARLLHPALLRPAREEAVR